MFRTNASTWIRARHDSAAASPTGIGTAPTASAQRHREDEVHRGPGERHEAARAPATGSRRGRSSTAPPGSGIPPSSRKSTGSTKVRRDVGVAADVEGQVAACPDRPVAAAVGRRARGRTRAGTATPPSRPARRARSPRRAPLPCRSPRELPAHRGTQEEQEERTDSPNHRMHQTSVPKRRPSGWIPSLGRPPTLAPALTDTDVLTGVSFAGAGGGGRVNRDHGTLTLVGPTQAVEPVSMDLLREPLVSSRCGRSGRGRRGAGLAGTGAVRPDRPRGVLPGEGRLHPGGQAHLLGLRGAGRVPGVRAGARRALRHLGRAVRAGAPPPAPRRRLTRASTAAAGRAPGEAKAAFGASDAPVAAFGARATGAQLRPRRRPRRPARC